MPIVPTQLLGYADGGMSQGWSTLYDLRLLNKDLLVKGKVVNDPNVVANYIGRVQTKAAEGGFTAAGERVTA